MSRIDSEERIRDHRGILKDGTRGRDNCVAVSRPPYFPFPEFPSLWPIKMEIQIGFGQPKEKEVSINSRYQTADSPPWPWFRPITSPCPQASLPRSFYSPCLARRLWKGGKAIPDRIFTSKKCSFIAAENRKDAGVFVHSERGTDQTKPSIWYCYLNWIWLRIVLRRFPNVANQLS